MSSTSAHPFAGFGANEWLVDEMYQQYLKDPSSVDKAWWDFFADYSPADPAAATETNGKAPVANGNGAPTAAPKQSAPAAVSAPTTTTSTQAVATPAAPAPAPAATPSAAPTATDVAVPVVADEIVPLKGAAARTVANMEASLHVPTATSVRDIPAKLVADNRLVMNNHLKRGRGGKISFTHIIGYAIVKATAALPEMNVAYTEIDGKPGVIRHHDVNLGLAIDMTKDDGTRQLLVPSIKAAQKLDSHSSGLPTRTSSGEPAPTS